MPHGVTAATRKVWPEKALTFVVVVARIELFCGREWRENVQPVSGNGQAERFAGFQ